MTPSENIADYTLGDILGVGTVGTVYSCVENSTGKSFAIKKLHPGVCRDPLIRARFKREMLVMQRLRHPNIVACYGGGEDTDGSLYYLMELIDGGTVKGLVANATKDALVGRCRTWPPNLQRPTVCSQQRRRPS